MSESRASIPLWAWGGLHGDGGSFGTGLALSGVTPTAVHLYRKKLIPPVEHGSSPQGLISVVLPTQHHVTITHLSLCFCKGAVHVMYFHRIALVTSFGEMSQTKPLQKSETNLKIKKDPRKRKTQNQSSCIPPAPTSKLLPALQAPLPPPHTNWTTNSHSSFLFPFQLPHETPLF